MKRRIWVTGPEIYNKYLIKKRNICSTALNKTSVIFISEKRDFATVRDVVLFDFKSNQWIEYPEVPKIPNDNLASVKCSCSITFKKDGSR